MSLMVHAGRKKTEEIRTRLRERDLDAAVFVNSEPVLDSNIPYLTGFRGMLNGALILDQESLRLITTELDYSRAQEQAQADGILKSKDSLRLFQSVKDQCRKYKRVGVVKGRFTLEMAQRIALRLSSMSDISQLMQRSRMIKEPCEIDSIRQSANIGNKGVRCLEDVISKGCKETRVAGELERMLKLNGSEHPPFETIVANGKRSAFIHPSPPASEKVLSEGPGVVDFGAVFQGYACDITVPFLLGRPSEGQDMITKLVLSVYEDVTKTIKEGIKTGDLHDIYSNALKGSGFKVKHSLGHSLGLDVHEYPSVSGSGVELKEGMVLAIEPGVYDRKIGGCRLENTVLVRKNGCEPLTKSKLIRV